MNLAAIKTKYQALVQSRIDLDAVYADIVDLGPIPEYLATSTTDASYNNVTTARATWNSDYTELRDGSLVPSQGAMLYRDTDLKSILPENQWVKLTGITGSGFEATVYIGWGSGTTNADNPHGFPSIVTSSVEPTSAYPLV